MEQQSKKWVGVQYFIIKNDEHNFDFFAYGAIPHFLCKMIL